MKPYTHEKELSLLPPIDPAAEILRLKKEILNLQDRNLRTLADFKNYRRRIERDSIKIAWEGKREIILLFLDIIDDMEKAMQYATDIEQPFVKGMQIIYDKILELLKIQGVLPIESVGKPFDYDFHEAVAMIKNIDSKPGTVVDELRRGYLWKSELLRPAQVRVAD